MKGPGNLSVSSWKDRPLVSGAIVVLVSAMIGIAVVLAPLAVWALVGAVFLLLLVLTPAHLRLGATVLAAAASRLLVATGYFPELLNFFHFPLALFSALLAAGESRTRSSQQRALGIGLIGLLAVCLFSWIINGGQPTQALLAWLVFAEPFLLVFALVAAPPDQRQQKALWGLVLAIPFAQFPLAVYQALTMGLRDPVQGLFVGLGAGAHVAGAVSLLGSLVCLARGLTVTRLRSRALWLLGGSLLFVVAVLADAKQVILAYFPALLLLLLGLVRLHWTRSIVALPVLGAIVLGAFSYYRPLQMALDWTLISRGILGKVQAFSVVASRLSSSVSGWVFGLGPGNSVSRVALMGLEGYIKPNSPVQLLGLKPAATAVELWNLTSSSWLFSASSVWSSVSSWLGLLGDLGLAGLACYLWLFFSLRPASRLPVKWQTGVCRAVLLMSGLLGFMFNWLEEPGFMIPAAVIVGLGLTGVRE